MKKRRVQKRDMQINEVVRAIKKVFCEKMHKREDSASSPKNDMNSHCSKKNEYKSC